MLKYAYIHIHTFIHKHRYTHGVSQIEKCDISLSKRTNEGRREMNVSYQRVICNNLITEVTYTGDVTHTGACTKRCQARRCCAEVQGVVQYCSHVETRRG